MDEKDDNKGEGIFINQVLTKEVLDDFKAVSMYLSKSVGIEHEFYGNSDQLDLPLNDTKPGYPPPLPQVFQ